MDVTREERIELMLEVARTEARGTVGYFEHLFSLEPLEEDIPVTGECAADIATLETIIAEGVPMLELPLNKALVAKSLIGTLNFCPLQVAGEFTFREEVQAFIAGLEHLTG